MKVQHSLVRPVASRRCLALLFLLAMFPANGAESAPHVFTDSQGRQSSAVITATATVTVTLRGTGGQEVTLPVATFSEADQRFIAMWSEAQKDGGIPPMATPVQPAGAVHGIVEYTQDGAPTAFEEEIRWLVNRGRYDSAKENALRGTFFHDVPASTGPLAPHQSLTVAARRHAEDMAKSSRMQHETVPKSAYYNAATQRTPWARFSAEGYVPGNVAENISAGRDTPLGNYLGWWKSTGHRTNMFRASMREIGTGYFIWPASRFKSYCTMDLGGPELPDFLTGTVFHDASGQGIYSAGSGVGGIRVDLRCGQTVHKDFDVSTATGSFAVPLSGITPGTNVEVLLTNANATPVSLTIPRDYDRSSIFELAPGEQRPFGFFTKTAIGSNAGFRNVTPLIEKAADATKGEQ